MNNKEKVLLENAIKEQLPEFYTMCNTEGNTKIIMSQKAFSLNEIELLGAAIKYAGECGKTFEIIP